jgi:DNA-directed RNA polymerase specialized sigma24 family protein
MTWLKYVAVRYFRKQQNKSFEHESDEYLIHIPDSDDIDELISRRFDIERLIGCMSNKVYRTVIRKLVLEEMNPKQLADVMEITVDNLYNIKSRAIRKLAQIAGKERN